MKRMHTLIFIILLAASAMAQDVNNDMRVAFANKDYLQAVSLAQHCYDTDTANIECLKILATASNKSGDQANAKKYLHILEQKDSSNTDVYIQLASIYEQQIQFAKAIKYYTIINKMLPENPLYFRKNANLYKGYGDKIEAFRLYSIANKINPRDVITLNGLAELALSNDQPALADSLIHEALSLDSMHIGMNYLLARSKYKQKQYHEVTEVFHRIQGQVDLNSYYNKMLGYAYLQLDSIDLAIHRLRLALVDDEDSEKLHYYLATAYEKQKNIDGALEHFDKAVEYGVSPDLDLYHRNVARLANKEKKYKKAIDAYQDAYKYSQDPILLYYLAAASDHYYKDKSIAIRYYTNYISSSHNHPEYVEYSKKRIRYLKEQKHQGKS